MDNHPLPHSSVKQIPADRETNDPALGPGVSVVIPSYNHASFVGRSLRSVIKQSLSPLELIVIDDGSRDGSIKAIDEVLNECQFPCELISRRNRGLAATLNEGFERSRGKYFAYLGSDDIWLPGFLRKRVEILESRSSAVLAFGHSYVIDEDDNIIECTRDWARYTDGDVRTMLLNQSVPFSSSVVYRRDALVRHGWNEQGGLEDYELYLRLCAEGEFAFDPRVLSAWRKHRYNTSRNLKFMLEECLRSQNEVAVSLGISSKELGKAQSALKWRYAGDFLKNGQRSEAIKLMMRNMGGAPSSFAAARMILELAMPGPAIRWKRERTMKRATGYYGSIEI
jgi:alpha-1,3-rhamnosyltransferase